MNSIKTKQPKMTPKSRASKRNMHTKSKPLNKSSLKTKTNTKNTHRRITSHRNLSTTTPQSTTPQAQVLFESPLDKRERFLTLGVMGLGVFASLQLTAGLIYSPDSSLIVPSLATLGSIGMTGYLRRAWDHRVTRIVVSGNDNDPVEITTPGLFTQDSTTKINRKDFTGLPINFDSRIFFDAKRPFICLVRDQQKKKIKTYMLNRSGLFDSSGPLNQLLGYDVVTFDRCPPSLPYQPLPQSVTSSQVKKEQQQQQRDV